MCGLAGFVNFTKDISDLKDVAICMNDELLKRGPDEEGFYFEEHVCLSHKRLIITDPEGGKQPISFIYNGNPYTLIYDGQLYNTEELRKELIDDGFIFNGYSDSEVLLKSFIKWDYKVLDKINGIFSFAIWNKNKNELFFARDHLGVKPLYYTQINDSFVFASEVKSILKFPQIDTQIDKEGLCELFGLGPAHTFGKCIFKNICELKPGHYGVYNKYRIIFIKILVFKK